VKKAQICLQKGDMTYVFRYPPGDEESLVKEIVDMVENHRNQLTWVDAANISYDLVRNALGDFQATR